MSTSASDCGFLYDDGVLVSLERIETANERDPAAGRRRWVGVPRLAFDDDRFR